MPTGSPKTFLDAEAWIREELTLGRPALGIREGLSAALDRELRAAVERHVTADALQRMALLAVGGYGRREVYPHADVDLVVLYDAAPGEPAVASADANVPSGAIPNVSADTPATAPATDTDTDTDTPDTDTDSDTSTSAASADARSTPAERLDRAVPGGSAAITALQTELRDAGYRLGLRVRSRSEQAEMIGSDVTVAAASLDARRVAGGLDGDAPLDMVRVAIRDRHPGGIEAFCALITEGVRQRHRQFGGSAYMLEPQVKSGRGGLRDAHALRWAALLRFGTFDERDLIAQGHIVPAEAEDFRRAFDFISRVRLALHTQSRWRNDRLAFERQEPVARLMGFGHGEGGAAIESFMQAYYRHAETLANLSERWLQEWATPIGGEEVTPLDEGFLLRDGRLALQEESPPERNVATAARILLRARDEGVRLHSSARSLLRDTASELEARAGLEPDARTLVRRALLAPSPDAYLLRVLLDVGLFPRLVPEWAHLVGHTSHDVYHVYTTDRHLFEAFCRLAALLHEEGEAPDFLREALASLVNHYPEAVESLLVAALLHDVGKGLDGDHSMIGAGMVHEVARRLGMNASQQALARWLVDEHLRMVRMSQRRDLSDEGTIRAFLEQVPDSVHLDALTVLSFVDMVSVGPGLQVDWKLQLLHTLHRAARSALRGKVRPPPRLRYRESMRALLEAEALCEEDVDWLEGELSARNWAAFSEGEVAAHAKMLLRGRAAPDWLELQVSRDVGPGTARLSVGTVDQAGLLHRLTAGIASERINILRARIFTTRSGLVLDVFDLAWADPSGRPLAARREERLLETLRAVIRGEIGADSLRARWTGESTMRRPARPPVPTEISKTPDPSDPEVTILEVKARDRVGLLAELSLLLSEFGFSIERSIITREGDRAIDTFYLRRGRGAAPTDDGLRRAILEAIQGLEEDDAAH